MDRLWRSFAMGILAVLLAAATLPALAFAKYPVIMVPGDAGCQIEARLHRQSGHAWCEWKSDWYTLWINLEMIIPEVLECFVDNLKLSMNTTSPSTTEWSYQPGVDIRIPDWGYTTAFETLDPSTPSVEPYFVDLVNAFLEQGYRENVSLRGVPYDWRLTPSNLSVLHDRIKDLIEETYSLNNNTPVVLLSHSMGGLVILSFLNDQTQSWRDQYVRAFIPISGPFGGSTKIVRMVVSGNREGIPLVTDLQIRPAQRTFASNGWLHPNPTVLKGDAVVVQTPTRNYTLFDADELYADAGFPEMSSILRSTNLSSIWTSAPPRVPTFCLYSINVKTEEKYVYGPGEFPDSQPTITYGQGDGTVNFDSLHRCQQWADQQSQPFKLMEFSGVDHFHLVRDKRLISSVIDIVTSLA